MHLVERRAPSISPHPPHSLHKHPHLRQHLPPRWVHRPYRQLLGLRILQRNGDQAARLQVFRRVPARQQRNAGAAMQASWMPSKLLTVRRSATRRVRSCWPVWKVQGCSSVVVMYWCWARSLSTRGAGCLARYLGVAQSMRRLLSSAVATRLESRDLSMPMSPTGQPSAIPHSTQVGI